jgi:hypothetical protein
LRFLVHRYVGEPHQTDFWIVRQAWLRAILLPPLAALPAPPGS